MTDTQKSKQKKALLLLPLIALPFVILAFWALGGGSAKTTAANEQKQGINTTLPAAKLPETFMDKLSLYNKVAQDSLELKNQLTGGLFSHTDTVADTQAAPKQNQAAGFPSSAGVASLDANDAKVREKLAQLERSLNQPPQAPAMTPPGNQDQALQQLMQQTNQENATDPQMKQLDGMLEKIMDIQHPERVQDRLKEQSAKNAGKVYGVDTAPEQDNADVFGGTRNTPTAPAYPSPVLQTNAFYDLHTGIADSTQSAINPINPINPIPAVVEQTQTVTSGATVKLRLTGDVFINGLQVPHNTFVYGTCSVDGERLKINISSIRYGNSLFPVSLSVHDLDGLEGVRVPGAISRDAAKQGTDQAIQSMQLMSLDPSVGAQAASAGLEAAKGLFSKKIRLVRVTVKAGYPVLLVDEKARD